ncbi:tripartite motif-containing protein 2-like [Dysidea avara]|uniref:tripartite motif-containing protein 2-like n=1 Tax=Dysidea avara TaxID=196820 RepID=UPI00332A06BF
MSAVEVKKLTCPVCYQLFNNPKYLPCYHSYCEGCLEKMQVQSKIICPECRKEAKVPARGVKEFATNFFINRLVDDLILKKKVAGEEKVNCDSCNEKDPVVSFCPDCNSFLCHACNDFHKRSKMFSSHGMVPLTELKSNKDVPIQAKPIVPLCKDHDEQLKYYCETCDELVCMYCTTKTHSGHNHDSLKNMASKHRSQLKKVTTPIEEMIQDLSGAHDNIDKVLKKIRKQGDEVNKKIDQHYDELVEKLMKQKDQMKQQVHDTVSQKEKALTTQLDEVDSTQAELVSMKELNDALEKSSDQEALSAKKQVIDGMQQLTEKYKKLKHPVQSVSIEFTPSKDPFPQFGSFSAIASLRTSVVASLPQSIIVGRKVEVMIITKDSNGDHCSTGGHMVFVQLKSFTDNVTVGEVRDNNDGSYVASFVGKQVGETKLHVSINGEEIRGSPYSIVVRNYKALNLPNKIVNNNGSMGETWGVAFGRNGVWAVADRSHHCVYVFDGQEKLVRKVVSSGSNTGQFSHPHGVAFDNDNHLYVADSSNHSVQKFYDNGNYLLQFGGHGSGDSQLANPYGITTHNGRVYVADNGNHRISVFQYNGQFCISFGSDQLGGPYDVAVNVNNQLLVADCNNHCIVTFTLDGQYVSKFGTQGSNRGQLKSPYSLATDVNGFILVSDGNHRVSVFDHVGNFIHCFGSKGSANGKYIYPYYVALSPNGSIYVSDCYNERIQIFTNY